MKPVSALSAGGSSKGASAEVLVATMIRTPDRLARVEKSSRPAEDIAGGYSSPSVYTFMLIAPGSMTNMPAFRRATIRSDFAASARDSHLP